MQKCYSSIPLLYIMSFGRSAHLPGAEDLYLMLSFLGNDIRI